VKTQEWPAVLTVEELAEVLRISRSAAYEAIQRGDVRAVRIGRTIRVARHECERLLGLSEGGEETNGRKTTAPASTEAVEGH
jgi:excisionase family DNA binding protein